MRGHKCLWGSEDRFKTTTDKTEKSLHHQARHKAGLATRRGSFSRREIEQGVTNADREN
ncbi:hypothetical protein ALP06_200275 [Pseudomonas coronafaciens pv. atropurpurea]|nr:hypothetical protein ALP06_200275 [Pseudomonas coronafaciens pv. atropurpurea]